AGNALTFTGNQLHHNALNQVLVTGSGLWNLNGSASLSCGPATANLFACYNGSPAPSPVSVGVAAAGGGTVQAHGNSWQEAMPLPFVDFAATMGAVFTPSPPAPNCPPSTITCP